MARSRFEPQGPFGNAGDVVRILTAAPTGGPESPARVVPVADVLDNDYQPFAGGQVHLDRNGMTPPLYGPDGVTSLTVLRADSVTTGTITAAAASGTSLALADEGSTVLASPTSLNFVGAGVTATDGGSGVGTVTIPGGGLPGNVLTKTANFTAAANDFILANAVSAGFTVTLPTAPATGALVTVKKVDTSANVVTVAPAGGGSIDGDANATIISPQLGAIFEHTGSNVWKIVAPTSAGGYNGIDGRTILNGSGAPSSATGNNGDYYIDTAATRLYGPKAAGAWGSYVSLVGPAGAAGGSGGLDLPATFNPLNRTGQAAIGNFGNRTHFCRNTMGGGTINKLRVVVITSSGNVAVAVYNQTGVGVAALPGVRAATSGSVPCPATGTADISLTAACSVVMGDFLSVAADNTTAQFASGGYTSNLEKWISGFIDTYPPPSPAGGTTYVDTKQFLIIGVT